MMCSEMTIEDQFLKTLEETDNYTLYGDTLFINNAGMSLPALFESAQLKLESDPEMKQIDKITFEKEFAMNGFHFNIVAKNHDLMIQPGGLQKNNQVVYHDIEGTVTNAEIGDLDADGFPEVLVYTNSEGSGS